MNRKRVVRVSEGLGEKTAHRLRTSWGIPLIGVFMTSAVAAQNLPVSGTVSYSGTQGSVSAARPIEVLLFNQPIGSAVNKPLDTFTAETSPGDFTFEVPAGTYYLAYYLDFTPYSAPQVGEPFRLYNGQSMPPGTALTVSGGGVTGLNLTFDDSAILSGIAGTVTYTGSLGSVSSNSRLIVERFGDATVSGAALDQNTVKSNGGRYDLITFDTGTWYLVAYLDLNDNRARDAGEPFTIYNHNGEPPADQVEASTTQTAIDITFGDENVAAAATATSTLSPSATQIPTPTPTPSCAGDCNDNSTVTVDEILTMVNIALGHSSLDDCLPGDANDDGQITVDEILAAVNNALNGCPLTPEQGCLASGGTVTTANCCATTGDFPDTCAIGACGCSPDGSHEVRACHCGTGCFNGAACVEH